MGMPLVLKETFNGLLLEYTADTALINSYWIEIERAYMNKGRHYHTLAHLESMLNELQEVMPDIKNRNTVLFSLYYHDIVYNVLKTTNEEQSAELAKKRLEALAVTPQVIENCYRQIIATQKHEPAEDNDTNFFIDADLSVLGKEWFFYEQYTQRIRKEYGIYPDLVYRPARKKVLQHFLDMKKIFKTDYFFQKYESKAKENLLKELKSL